MIYDLIIIGGGPAGYNAAEKAASNGMQTLLIEAKAVGGVCLNEGCIPTKTLLYAAKLLDNARTGHKYGIQISGEPTADMEAWIARKNKTVKTLTSGVEFKLKTHGVDVVYASAVIEGETDEGIRIRAAEQHYQGRYVLLSTGSDTFIPPINGLDSVDYWTSREALDAIDLPKQLVIIGGGVIGMEFASLYNSLQVDVHVVEMLPEILGGMDAETAAMLRQTYQKRGITFHLDTKVTQVSPTEVQIEHKGKISHLQADRILLSVGRKANLTGFGLETLGIDTTGKGLPVNDRMQTTHPRVYAAGDVTGYSMLAHTAIREGEVAVNNLCGKEDRMSYAAIPGVVYTNPELAGVGPTEAVLKEAGQIYDVIKLPMAYSGRFVAENEGGNGLCKLLIDPDGYVLACHMMGNPASELIVVAGMAIEQHMHVEAFQKVVFPHPTVGEIFHEGLFM